MNYYGGLLHAGLQTVLDTALDAVVVMDTDGLVIGWNAHSEQVFGWTWEEVQGKRLSDLIVPTDLRAARLLCRHAAELRDAGDPAAAEETFVAKYFASTAATRAALDAVQVHGANGCSEAYPAERLLRDSRVMEIIEGSTQIQQLTIAANEYRRFDASVA